MKTIKFFTIFFLCTGISLVSLLAQTSTESTQTQETEKARPADDTKKTDKTNQVDNTDRSETVPGKSTEPEEENITPLPPEEAGEALGEEEILTGDFVYNPGGRRDPFWNPLAGKNINIKGEKIEGIAGMLIDELDLEGIIFTEGKYLALFKGPDGIPYDIKVGDNVYDGEVIKIDMNSVVFKRILTIALGGTKEKLIIKSLTPEEEAAKK